MAALDTRNANVLQQGLGFAADDVMQTERLRAAQTCEVPSRVQLIPFKGTSEQAVDVFVIPFIDDVSVKHRIVVFDDPKIGERVGFSDQKQTLGSLGITEILGDKIGMSFLKYLQANGESNPILGDAYAACQKAGGARFSVGKGCINGTNHYFDPLLDGDGIPNPNLRALETYPHKIILGRL